MVSTYLTLYICAKQMIYIIESQKGMALKYIGADESVLVAEFNNRPKILAITESAIFYESDCEVGIKEFV